MFKLLTEEERDKVSAEYNTRRVVVIFLGLILTLTIALIGLMPSYLLSDIREKEVRERARIVNTGGSKGDGEDLQAWLLEINRRLSVLSPTLDTDRPSQFIDKIVKEKIGGVGLTAFSWTKAKDKISLSVSGISTDRQTLMRFQNGINSSGIFSNVTLPISNLANDKDIVFQIKFTPI